MIALFRKLLWLVQRRRREDEIPEELQFHLDEEAGERQAAGLSPEQAFWAARRELGNVTLVRESTRAMWTWAFVEQFGQDLRYAFRAMNHSRAFTAAAALSLALGIGANTAIYSFMDAIMIRSLPVSQPGELVILNWRAKGDPAVKHEHWGETYELPGGGQASPNHPYPAYELLRDKNSVLSSLFGYAGAGRLNLEIDGQAELSRGQYVTGNFFSGLGVPPAAGRLIGPGDDLAGAPPVAVITYDYWRARFAGDPAIMGKSIQINRAAFTIAGVAAPEFFGVSPNRKPSIFIPLANIGLTDSMYDNWHEKMHDGTFYWIELMGRLKPGVTLPRAQPELAGMFHAFVDSTIKTDRERSNPPELWLQEGGSGFDSLRREYSKSLWTLMAMVGLILTIASANVANLLLARAESRRREMAVRLSLGAGRFRVVRQLLTESVLLAGMSGLFGVGIAALGIRILTFLFTNGENDFSVQVGLDWRVLSFTLLVALGTGLLFGLAPAIQATKVDVAPTLKESRSSAVRTRSRVFYLPFRLSHVLVVAQIAMSLLLVVAAGLFVRTLANLRSVELGFNGTNLLLFNLDAGKAGYKGAAAKHLYEGLASRFRSIPGVRAATLTNLPMVADWQNSTRISGPGIPDPPEGQARPGTDFAFVGPTFFETMEIPILVGRSLNDRDREGGKTVVIVNDVFVRKYFPDSNPIGRHFNMFGGKNRTEVEIVGVSRNARYDSLRGEIPPVTYLSYLQEPDVRAAHNMFFELRTTGDPLALANTVRQIVHDAAPQVPVGDLTTQSRRIDETIQQARTFAGLGSCFSALALMIAFVGLYGTVSYSVIRRTGEIGIRMALGAQRRTVLWMVLREVIVLIAAGLLVSLPVAFTASRFVESFLFGMKPNDPTAVTLAVAILLGATLLAGFFPARRGSRVDPMIALRHE